MQRTNFSSGTPWESLAGYSRVVRIGNFVFVAGTSSADTDGSIHGGESAYEQTKFILGKIESALNQAGSELKDVVRTRIFVRDMSMYNDILKAHNEFFHDIRPASTIVEVNSLIAKEMLVEIEADAIIV